MITQTPNGPIIFRGMEYTCDYEWIKFEKDSISGSNNKTAWHPLRGRQLMAFDNSPKPDIIQRPKEYDPMNF